MTHIGLSGSQVIYTSVIMVSAMVLINIPLGVIADRWSRKGVLMLGSLALAAASVICGLSQGAAQYMGGIVFWGIYYACVSGVYDSVIYDVLQEERITGKASFEHHYGKLQVYNAAAFVISSLIGGVIGQYVAVRSAFLLSVPVILLSLIPLIIFREPLLHKKVVHLPVITNLRRLVELLTGNARLIYIVVSMALFGSALTMQGELGPLWLAKLSLPVLFFGPVIAINQSSLGIGGAIASRLSGRHRLIALVAFVTAALSLAFTRHSLVFVVIAQAISSVGLMTALILLSRYLHDEVPSHLRVSASSVVSTIGYLVFVPLALLLALISHFSSIFVGAWLWVLTVTAASTVLIILVGADRSTKVQAVLEPESKVAR